MSQPVRLIMLILAIPMVLAACEGVPLGATGGGSVPAASAAGGEAACRAVIAPRAGVTPDQLGVAALGRDEQGFGRYRVTAGSRTYACTVDANNVVLSL